MSKEMQTHAIDIHHHYVPERVVDEAKRHGKALGVQTFDDRDGTVRFLLAAVQDIRCCVLKLSLT